MKIILLDEGIKVILSNNKGTLKLEIGSEEMNYE